MKRIRIDGIAEGLAAQYKEEHLKTLSGLSNIDKIVVTTIGKSEAAANVQDYVAKLMSEYEDLLTREPQEWKKTEYGKLLPRDAEGNVDYAVLSEKYEFEIIYKDKDIQPEKKNEKAYKFILSLLKYSEARKIIAQVHRELNIRACVYCNAAPTVSHEEDVYYEMDHFMPESKYPFLGVNFYNLQPCCGSCNKRKGINIEDFDLYRTELALQSDEYPYHLRPILSKEFTGELRNCVEIQLWQAKGNKRYDTRVNRTFNKKIEKKYQAFRYVVDEIYEEYRNYPDTVIEAWKDSLGIQATEQVLCKKIFGFTMDESHLHEEQLLRLKIDTVDQMKEAGLLKKLMKLVPKTNN